jgi:hypothetical protein
MSFEGTSFLMWMVSIFASFMTAYVFTIPCSSLYMVFFPIFTVWSLRLACQGGDRKKIFFSYIFLVTQLAFILFTDRPISSDIGKYMALGFYAFILPVILGALGQLITGRWFAASLSLMCMSPFLLLWLFLRDWVRFSQDGYVALSYFYDLGLISLIGPSVLYGIQAVLMLMAGGITKFVEDRL